MSSDVELVIRIPEHYYENNVKQELPICLTEDHIVAVLPKGHGDLIDRNDLLEFTDINMCAYTPTITRYDIITTDTIIEANTESEE